MTGPAFVASLADFGERVALVDDSGERVTYAELDRRVEEREPLVVLDDLGQHLLRRGCGEAVVDGRPELGEGREALVERERGGAEAKLPVAVFLYVLRVEYG